MARKPAARLPKADKGVAVTTPTIPWMQTPGMYLAGRSFLDEADAIEVEMELKWGRDRLRLLVSHELREKFDRQRYLTAQARWSGNLEDVRREAKRMATAWRVLDTAAAEGGAKELDPELWEVTLHDGTVATIVKDPTFLSRVVADGRKINAYTLDEIANMISAFPEICKAKAEFPGATVTRTRTRVDDPLQTPLGDSPEGIHEATPPIDGVEGFRGEVSPKSMLNDDIGF